MKAWTDEDQKQLDELLARREALVQAGVEIEKKLFPLLGCRTVGDGTAVLRNVDEIIRVLAPYAEFTYWQQVMDEFVQLNGTYYDGVPDLAKVMATPPPTPAKRILPNKLKRRIAPRAPGERARFFYVDPDGNESITFFSESAMEDEIRAKYNEPTD